MTRVKRAATGWTISMAERVFRVVAGRSNVESWSLVYIKSGGISHSVHVLRRLVFQRLHFHSPKLYPISILLHLPALQKPKTPKSTLSNVAKGICVMIGVERTEMRSKTNAANSRIVRGVAGLNMTKWRESGCQSDCGCQRLQDAALEVVRFAMRCEASKEL